MSTADAIRFLEDSVAAGVKGRGFIASQEELDAVAEYLRLVLLHAPFGRSLAETPRWTTAFDVEAWYRDGATRPLSSYRFDAPRTFVAQVEPERRALIETRIATFGEHPSGLGKFTRTMFARDLRRTLVPAVAPADAPAMPSGCSTTAGCSA